MTFWGTLVANEVHKFSNELVWGQDGSWGGSWGQLPATCLNTFNLETQEVISPYLKDSEQRLPEGVEVAARFVDERVEVELSAEQLHAE